MLEISRADIRFDEIVEYPAATRFIKLPITGYLDLLNFSPIPSQIALINAINCPKYRFICAALSRRQGKTYIANIIAHLITLVPGCNILIMSPNYSLSQISFELQRKLIKTFDIEVTRDNAKDKIIEISNGSTVRMGSVSQVDSCVGRSYDLIIFDEAALSNGMEAFNVALRPTLDKPNSKALFISTPRGKTNWFAQFYAYGWSMDPRYKEWCSIRATWEANPRMSPDDVESARSTMSVAEFKQEYEADFNTFEGQIWNFDSSSCVARIENHCELEVFAGLDVGHRDPTAMVVVGYSWTEKRYYVLDEYQENGQSTAHYAANIQRLVDKWGVQRIYIDSAAAQTRYDLAQLYGISTINAKKDVLPGISYVGNIVETGCLTVAPDCTHVLAALDNYQWDMTPNRIREAPVHSPVCHAADALRYALYSFQVSNIIF